MLRVLTLQFLTKIRVIFFWIMMSAFALQGAALAVHQGKHLAQAAQTSERAQAVLDDGPCAPCIALHQFSESPNWGIALSSFSPLVSILISLQPVDPKANIFRTCDARGPPSFL